MTTYTSTLTSTYTEVSARYVMDKVFDDLTAIVVRGFTTSDKIKKWKEDLLYLMSEQVLNFFEIQLYIPNKDTVAIRYVIKSDNSISSDSSSGNLGLYDLPVDTKANLFADLKKDSPNYQRAYDELHNKRSWGFGNQANGTMDQQHSYSKEGFGVNRNKIGTW